MVLRFFIFALLFAIIVAYIGKWVYIWWRKFNDKQAIAFEKELHDLDSAKNKSIKEIYKTKNPTKPRGKKQ
jgi:predicted membrane protein